MAKSMEKPSALRVIDSAEADIAIVDLTLEDGSGLELIKDIAVRFPEMRVLVLSMRDESVFAERVLPIVLLEHLHDVPLPFPERRQDGLVEIFPQYLKLVGILKDCVFPSHQESSSSVNRTHVVA